MSSRAKSVVLLPWMFLITVALGEEPAQQPQPRVVLRYELETIPASGEFRMPRQYARLHDVHWQGADTPLKLTPLQREWVIQLSDPPTADRTLVVSLLDPIAEDSSTLTRIPLSSDQPTTLPAHLAEPHGKKLVYEPQPHKNTLGYWVHPEDWAEWTIADAPSGEFQVDIWQGCGTGQGGSHVRILLRRGKQIVDELAFVVEDTGHFQNFRQRRLGKLTFPQDGEYRLEIRPVDVAHKAVMDVRKIVLTPVN